MSISRSVLLSLGIRAGSTMLGIATVLVLTRLLGPEAFGIYAVALTVASVLALPAQAGVRLLLVRDIAVAHDAGDAARIRAVRRDVGRFAVLLSVATALIGIAVLQVPELGPGWKSALTLAILSIPLLALASVWGAVLQGQALVLQAQLGLQILRPVVVVVLGGGALWLWTEPPRAADALVIHLIALSAAAAYSFAILRRRVARSEAEAAPGMAIKSVAAAAGSLSLVAALVTLKSAVALLLLGALAPPEEAALFRVASSAAALVSAAQISVNQVIAPRLAALNGRQDLTGLQGIMTWSVRIGALIGVGAALVLVLAGPSLLGAFGPAFPDSYGAMVVLVAGNLAILSFGPNILILTMTGHERTVALGLGIGLGATLALGAVLVPILGAVGAAIAQGLSGLVWGTILTVRVRGLLNVRPTIWTSAATALKTRN